MTEVAYDVLGEFPYSIHRHDELGHLCGYLGVPKSHPWYGKDYDELGSVEVHGGLTHFGPEHICYVASKARGEYLLTHRSPSSDFDSDEFDALPRWDTITTGEAFPHDTGLDIWWVGFDCGHFGDISPGVPTHNPNATYKDEAFVLRELEGLAKQAAQRVREGK